MRALRPTLTLLALLITAVGPLLATSPVALSAERVPGQSYFGPDRYVEHLAGNLPIVLTSPHGGRLRPESIADRAEGVRRLLLRAS